MGYPGRTFRNETAPYLAFQENVNLPKIQGFYAWYLSQIKDITKDNEAERLAFAGDVQSLENVEKNYRGKIQGLRRTQLVDARNNEENQMLQWAKNQPRYKKTGVAAIDTLRNLWAVKNATKDVRYWTQFTNNQSKYSFAIAAIENARMQWAIVLNNEKKLNASSATSTANSTAEAKKAILSSLSKQLGAIEIPLNQELEKRVLVKLAIEGIELMKHTDVIANNYRRSNMFGENQAYFDNRLKVMLKGQSPETWAKNAAALTRIKQITEIKNKLGKEKAKYYCLEKECKEFPYSDSKKPILVRKNNEIVELSKASSIAQALINKDRELDIKWFFAPKECFK